MANAKNKKMTKKKYTLGEILKFLIPSLIGVILFMTPIIIDDGVTIPVAILSNALKSALSGVLPMIIVGIILITTISTFVYKMLSLAKPDYKLDNEFLHKMLTVNWVWFTIRMLSGIFVVLVLYIIQMY